MRCNRGHAKNKSKSNQTAINAKHNRFWFAEWYHAKKGGMVGEERNGNQTIKYTNRGRVKADIATEPDSEGPPQSDSNEGRGGALQKTAGGRG